MNQMTAKTKFLNEQQIFLSQTSKMLKVLQLTPFIHALFHVQLIGKGSQFTETLFKRNLRGNFKQRKKYTFSSSGHYFFTF